eukprot:754506-Hanusia_phi.AAC.5
MGRFMHTRQTDEHVSRSPIIRRDDRDCSFAARRLSQLSIQPSPFIQMFHQLELLVGSLQLLLNLYQRISSLLISSNLLLTSQPLHLLIHLLVIMIGILDIQHEGRRTPIILVLPVRAREPVAALPPGPGLQTCNVSTAIIMSFVCEQPPLPHQLLFQLFLQLCLPLYVVHLRLHVSHGPPPPPSPPP